MTSKTDPAAADTAAAATVVSQHWHGHTRHRHKVHTDDGAHHHVDGQPVFGAWEQPGVAPWLSSEVDEAPDAHRHGTSDEAADHDHGRIAHDHDPTSGAPFTLPGALTLTDPAPDHTHQRGVVTAPADDTIQDLAGYDERGLPLDPVLRARVRDDLRRALAAINGSAPPPEAVPAPVAAGDGGDQPGASIADPVAHGALDAILHEDVTDPRLQHEMTWHRILTPLVLRMATHHADNRPKGGAGPELAPPELVMAARDAMQQIVQPRLVPLPTDPAADAPSR